MAKKNALVRAGKSSLPADIRKLALKDAGKGVSTDASDNMVPLIYILQAQSPQAMKKNPKYIQGAEEGCLWLRNSPDPIVPGEEGFIFQPCFFAKVWIEWMPNRGGFVARHNGRPPEAKLVKDKTSKREAWTMPNKNIVNESREFAGYVLERGAAMPYIIPMSGSGHSVARSWMASMTRNIEDGHILPSWTKTYKITTRYRTNDDGSWYTYEVAEHEPITSMDEYERGKALNASFSGGEKTAADIESDI